ncbi:hypothetical protein QL285_015770 [Trifolium repens]|nr:hypothetical protein QL285_015770 [Trifolium repens]
MTNSILQSVAPSAAILRPAQMIVPVPASEFSRQFLTISLILHMITLFQCMFNFLECQSKKDLSTMKLEELQCSLEAHEQRLDERTKDRAAIKKGKKFKDKFKKDNSQQDRTKNNEQAQASS